MNEPIFTLETTPDGSRRLFTDPWTARRDAEPSSAAAAVAGAAAGRRLRDGGHGLPPAISGPVLTEAGYRAGAA